MIRFGFSLLVSCVLIWVVVRQDPSAKAPGSPAEPTEHSVSVVLEPLSTPMAAVAAQEEASPSAASRRLAKPVVVADQAEPTALGRRVALDPAALQRIRDWTAAGDCDIAWFPTDESTFVWQSTSGITEVPIEDLARFERGGGILIRLADPGPEVLSLLELTGDVRGAIILRLNRLAASSEPLSGPLVLSAGPDGSPLLAMAGEDGVRGP